MDARNLDDGTVFTLLTSVSASNTAGATSGTGQWIDMSTLEGDVAFIMNCGALTGSLTGKLQSAVDANGTSAADITGAVFAAAVAGTAQAVYISANSTANRYVGFVGTIVTGPAVVGVVAYGRGPK